MKRPQGFDRTGSRASGPFDVAARQEPHADRRTADPRDPDTEPIPVVATPIAPRPIGSAPAPGGFAPTPSTPDASTPGVSAPSQYGSSPYGSRSAARVARRATRERKRYERGEVKRFTKRTRRRRAVWLICVSATVAVLVLAITTAFSPLMALRTIDVVGTSRLHQDAVVKALDSQLGKPLPLIDFGVIKRELGSFTLIRSYSTETHPPGTLIVHIVERQPIGLLKTAAGFELVDQAGVVISSSSDRPGGYPVIASSGGAAGAGSTSGFRASTSVLSALPASVLPQVQTVSAKTTDDVTLILAGGKTVVWGSPDRSALKAADLAALLASAPDASVYDVSAPQSPVTK
jgi:cell division protein FtsQ